MARVIYKPAAEVEVAAIFRSYEEQREGLGVEFLDELLRVEHHLGFNPALYQRVDGDMRRALLRRFPYGLLYVIDGAEVTILSCFHLHRRPPRRAALLAR
jgi:plasmid stabilization system protein ParE